MTFLLFAACAPVDVPWWASDDPCPDGAALVGDPWPTDRPVTPPPGPLTPHERVNHNHAFEVQCKAGAQGLGRGSSWWGNGQRQTDYELSGAGLVWLEEFDEHGRRTHHMRCATPGEGDSCSGGRTWWHHTGVKGVEGAYEGRSPTGTWREWDPNGALIGEVLMAHGAPPTRVAGTSNRLLVADLMRHDVWVTPPEGLQLPVGTATATPLLAVNVVVDDRQVVVDGEWLGDRGSDGLADKLVEVLIDRRTTEEELRATSGLGDFDGRLLLQGDRAATYAEIAALLRAATTVGYTRFDVVVDNPQRRLPPFEGPPRSRAWVSLSTFTVTLAPPGPGVVPAAATLQDMVRASDAVRGEAAAIRWSAPESG